MSFNLKFMTSSTKSFFHPPYNPGIGVREYYLFRADIEPFKEEIVAKEYKFDEFLIDFFTYLRFVYVQKKISCLLAKCAIYFVLKFCLLKWESKIIVVTNNFLVLWSKSISLTCIWLSCILFRFTVYLRINH